MNVDDHAIDSLRVWFDLALKSVIEEHTKEPAKKVSELESFKAAKAYEKALNILIDAYYLPEVSKNYRLSVVKEVKEYDEIRKTFGDEVTFNLYKNR